MSACMRSLYSSDQWAPGFSLLVFCGRGTGGVLLSLGDFLTPAFSLSVARGDVGLEDEFELSMQLLCTSFNLLLARAGTRARMSRLSGIRVAAFPVELHTCKNTPATMKDIVLNINCRIQKDTPADRVGVSLTRETSRLSCRPPQCGFPRNREAYAR